jgi:predicted transcriptional regulator
VTHSNKKHQAQILLSQDIPQIRVAELLKISRKTVSRWLKEPGFKEEVIRGRKSQLEAALSRNMPTNIGEEIEFCLNKKQDTLSLSEKLIAKSFAVLDLILTNPESRTSDQLKAIQIILSQCGGASVSNFGVSEQDKLNASPQERSRSIDALLERREKLRQRIDLVTHESHGKG